MNRKTLIILIVCCVVLLAVLCAALVGLRTGRGEGEGEGVGMPNTTQQTGSTGDTVVDPTGTVDPTDFAGPTVGVEDGDDKENSVGNGSDSIDFDDLLGIGDKESSTNPKPTDPKPTDPKPTEPEQNTPENTEPEQNTGNGGVVEQPGDIDVPLS